jgi:RNA polymerase-binding transcription factor DksA
MDDGDISKAAEIRDEAIAIRELQSRMQAHGPAAEYCTECGDVIPMERRKVIWWSSLCVDCQREAEELRGGR